MYFKRSDIQNVKNHITKHANELNVMVGAKDDESYNKALNTILKTKQYYEGEQIDQKHMTVLKKNINNIIINTSNYLIKNADMLKGTVNLSNPVDYLTTAIDGFFITAMERLGCPNMPLPHFDPEIKNTLINSAIELNRSFAVYDFSKDDTFTAQRGKDAAEVNKIFGAHVKGLKENKAESVGKMVAEYQALRERQQNHGFFWRMLHRTENKARNDLLEKMKNFITNQLPGGMKKIDLDEVVPTMLARNLADACIRGEVEVAGVKRLDPKASEKVFGLQPSDEAIPNQQKLFDELSQKESMSKDANFVKDVLGNDHVKSEPTANKNHTEKQNIIGKNNFLRRKIMEQARKKLKTSSIIVLALAGLSLLNLIFGIFFGDLNTELNNATIPDGSPDNVILIAKIFVLVVSILMLLPQLYIGLKGLKMAKKPDSSRGHIIWGIILVVVTAIGLLSPLAAFLQGDGDAFANVAEFMSIAVDVVVLFEFVKYARAVRKAV